MPWIRSSGSPLPRRSELTHTVTPERSAQLAYVVLHLLDHGASPAGALDDSIGERADHNGAHRLYEADGARHINTPLTLLYAAHHHRGAVGDRQLPAQRPRQLLAYVAEARQVGAEAPHHVG